MTGDLPSDVQDLFPAYEIDEVMQRVHERWRMVKGFPFPRADRPLTCPQCGTRGVQARKWVFHKRKGKAHPWRCDVMFKCCECSMAWTHDVVLAGDPREHDKVLHRNYSWRDVREMVTE